MTSADIPLKDRPGRIHMAQDRNRMNTGKMGIETGGGYLYEYFAKYPKSFCSDFEEVFKN